MKTITVVAALVVAVSTVAMAADVIKLQDAATGAEYGPVELVDGATIKVGEITLVVKTVKQTAAQAALEKKLKSLVIPNLALREAKITAVLNFLRQQARELDPDQGVNIVLRGDPQSLPALSLSLQNVSLWDALQYIGDATGAKIRIDDNAVVLTP